MEDITPTQPVIDTMPRMQRSVGVTTPNHPHHKIVKILIIVVVTLGIIALALLGYGLWKKHHQPARTPQQALEDLRKASYNDSGTDDHKGATLNTLEKSSRPNPVSTKDQLQTLNDLRQ